MFRLVLKDLQVGKLLLLVFMVFWSTTTLGMFQASIDFFFLVVIFGTIIADMVPMGTESRDNTETLYISLPIKRNIIIISRYISSAIIITVSLEWGVALGFIMNKYLPGQGPGLVKIISPGGLALFVFMAILAISILIPIFIKSGFIFSMTLGSTVSILVTFGLVFIASYLVSLNTSLLAAVNISGGSGLVLDIIKAIN